MLRIWPIYYLSIAIAVTCIYFLGQKPDGTGLFFYIFMMANIPFVFGGALTFVGQLWSVGVEEQFYLFWPWLFKQKIHLLKIMLGTTRIHCMAIGGIGALMVFEKRNILKYVYHPVAQVTCWSIMIVSLYRPFHTFSIIDGELYALIFLVMIINVSTNPGSIIKLDNKLLNWLGKISYGIYVYHMFAIAIVFSMLEGKIDIAYQAMALVYMSVLGCTLILAHVSYRYYEKFFLGMKHQFAIIKVSSFIPIQP